MADTKTTSSSSRTPTSMPFPMMDFGWLKSVTESQQALHQELYQFSASRLRAQADLVQSLGECKSMPELVQRQADFFGKAMTSYGDEAMKAFKRASSVFNTPGQ